MNKKKIIWHGREYTLLGKGVDGRHYYLEKESWDCGWYWGFGYVESFSNDRNPAMSADIASHSHFDSMFLDSGCAIDNFREFFAESTLSESEAYELCDLMMSAYTLKSAAELLKRGHSNQTERAKIDSLKREDRASEINEKMLPDVFARIHEILG